MLKSAKGQEVPSNKARWELEIWINLWQVLPEMWIELLELMQEEEIHNPPETSKEWLRAFFPRLPEIMDFPVCSYADNGLVSMDANKSTFGSPHSWNATSEEDTFLETISWLIAGFHIEMGKYVSWVESLTILVSQIHNVAGQFGKEGDTVLLDKIHRL